MYTEQITQSSETYTVQDIYKQFANMMIQLHNFILNRIIFIYPNIQVLVI